MEKQDEQKKRKLREPLDIGEKDLLIVERLKKKDAPSILHKSLIENKSFCKINKRVGINNSKKNYYWVEKCGRRIKDRFLRQELFSLKGQFE